MDSLRVAALQCFIRPVDSFDGFADQVSALVAAAADYDARLIVFPEYFTTQLLTLGAVDLPVDAQIRLLADRDDYDMEDTWRDFTDGRRAWRSSGSSASSASARARASLPTGNGPTG